MSSDENPQPRRLRPPRRPFPPFLVACASALLLVLGFLAGSYTFEYLHTEHVQVDLYWKDFTGAEPRFLGTRMLPVTVGEELRIPGGYGQQAILVLCAPGSRSPCGEVAVGPEEVAGDEEALP